MADKKLTAAEKALLKKLLAGLSDEEKESLIPEKKQVTFKEKQRQTNVQLGPRPNKFVKSADFNKFKSDTAIDKALWGNNTPEERSELILIEATCVNCGTKKEVHPTFCYADEKGKRHFTCDRCSK